MAWYNLPEMTYHFSPKIIFTISALFFIFYFSQNTFAAADLKWETEIYALKAKFIKEITSSDDPEVVLAIAVLYAGRIWEIAARGLAERFGEKEAYEYVERIEAENTDEVKNVTSDYLQFQVMGMKKYFQSTRAVAGILAFKRASPEDLLRVKSIEERLNQIIRSEKVGMEVMVSFARGTMIMLSLIIRFIDEDHRFTSQVNEELEFRVRQTEAIRARTDIHNYSKLFHSAVNYSRGGFRLIYFLNIYMGGKPLSEVTFIHNTWKEQIRSEDNTSIRAIAVDLTATVEASFPLVEALIKR